MSLFTDETRKQCIAWIRGMEAEDIIGNLAVLERLLGTEDMRDCLLADEAIELVDMLRDECVRRVHVLSQSDVPLADCLWHVL